MVGADVQGMNLGADVATAPLPLPFATIVNTSVFQNPNRRWRSPPPLVRKETKEKKKKKKELEVVSRNF